MSGVASSIRLKSKRLCPFDSIAMSERLPSVFLRHHVCWEGLLADVRRRKSRGKLPTDVHLLDLSGQRSGKAWPTLKEVLKEFSVVYTLDLTGAHFNDVEPLVEALGGLYKMKRLRIGDNLFNLEDIEKLVSAMRRSNANNGPTWIEVGCDPALNK